MERFTYFFRDRSPFSQWYPSKFSLLVTIPGDGKKLGHLAFTRAEQAMMYSKSALFSDWETAVHIMYTDDPKEQKDLGRKVKPFDANIWRTECRRIVYEINYAKFTQNDKLKATLLATQGTTLVEASPYDKIWGIGLTEDDPRAAKRELWRGTNWLGEALTQVRETIIKES